MHPAPESSNATFFLMADHSLDRAWGGSTAVIWATERPSSSGLSGIFPVYAAPRRERRPTSRG